MLPEYLCSCVLALVLAMVGRTLEGEELQTHGYRKTIAHTLALVSAVFAIFWLVEFYFAPCSSLVP